MKDLESIILKGFEDKYAPPDDPVLDFSIVGDILFLSIRKYEETYSTTTLTTIAQIGVNLDVFLRLLNESREIDKRPASGTM